MGKHCNECKPGTFGLQSGRGCNDCGCDVSGTVFGSHLCDIKTGQQLAQLLTLFLLSDHRMLTSPHFLLLPQVNARVGQTDSTEPAMAVLTASTNRMRTAGPAFKHFQIFKLE